MKPENGDEGEGEDQPVLLRRHRIDEVGLQVRHVALHDAFAGTDAEQAALGDGFGRLVDLMRVGLAGRQEFMEARGHMAEGEIDGDEPAERGDAEPQHPLQRHPRHEEGRAERDGDQHRLADVGLYQQPAPPPSP